MPAATRMRQSTTIAAVAGSYVDVDDEATPASNVITFTNLVPARDSERRIVAAVAWHDNPRRTLSSVTICGVAASVKQTELAGVGTECAIVDAIVPAGAAGNVVVTLSATPDGCMAAVYDLGPAEYRVGDTDTGIGDADLSVAVKAGEYAIAVANCFDSVPQPPNNHVWTDLTRNAHVAADECRYSSASAAIAADATLSPNVSSSGAVEIAACIAVYRRLH